MLKDILLKSIVNDFISWFQKASPAVIALAQ